MKNRVVFNMQ